MDIMPTNDQNGIGATPVPSTNNTTPMSQDISDLGDILMEKSLDKTQNSDFVGVKSSDVDQLSASSMMSQPNSNISTDDSSLETTEGMGTNIGQAQNAIVETIIEQPVVVPSFDLGDITLDNSTPAPVATKESTATEAPMDLNALESLSIPESAPISLNTTQEVVSENTAIDNSSQEIVSPETTTVETPSQDVVVAESSIQSPIETTTFENTSNPESATNSNQIANDMMSNEVAGAENISTTPDSTTKTETVAEMTIVDSMPSAEVVQSPVVSNSNSTSTDILDGINLEVAPSNKSTDTPMFHVDIPSDTSSVAPISNNSINDIVIPETIPSSEAVPNSMVITEPVVEERAPEIVVINDQQQGVDLDSLMAETQAVSPATQAVSPSAPVVAVATTPTTLDPKSNKKQLSIILLLLGVIAAGGLAFFGYKAMYPVGVDGPTTGSTDQDIGTPMIITGNSMTGDTMNTGSMMTDDNTMSNTGTAIEDTGTDISGTTTNNATISYDTLVQSGNDLLVRARKLLIKASIDKNGPARITAFGIQKDIEDFQQTLEKNTDISTLGEATKIIAGLSQRLDSLDQKLHGNSNQ